MDLNNIELFSSLSEEEIKQISYFFQEYFLEKDKFLVKVGDELNGVYFLKKGQILAYDKNGKGLGFLNRNSVVGASVIYDFSKKNKILDINLKAFLDCDFLIIPSEIIRDLTDKDRLIFSKIINQIRNEKNIFNKNIIL